MRFFKNVSQKVVQARAGKKSLCDLGRARPKKSVFLFAQEKNGGRVQKKRRKNNDVQVPEMKN